jgi:hypothetical protein
VILPVGFAVIAIRYLVYALKHFREGIAREEFI